MLEGVCTLGELETTWSIDDAMRALAVLEYRAAVQAANEPKKPDRP